MIETLGSRFKQEREKLEMSQSALAEELGLSREMVGKYERNIAQPGADTAAALYKLGFDVLYMLTGDRGPTESELKIIEKHRAEKKALEDQQAFIDNALEVANKFRKWSKESGEGLTFSTFVNTFGYQQTDANKMFSALVKIFDVLNEI